MLYHSLSMSHIRYCISSWCFGNETLIDKLQRLCNNFIRIIFNLFHRKNASRTMSEHSLITTKHMYKMEISILMFKCQKNLLPRSFDKIFIQKSFHMKTRSSSNIVASFCRSTVIQQSLKFIGPKVWNNIPLIIKNSKINNAFKKIKLIPFKFLTFQILYFINLKILTSWCLFLLLFFSENLYPIR